MRDAWEADRGRLIVRVGSDLSRFDTPGGSESMDPVKDWVFLCRPKIIVSPRVMYTSGSEGVSCTGDERRGEEDAAMVDDVGVARRERSCSPSTRLAGVVRWVDVVRSAKRRRGRAGTLNGIGCPGRFVANFDFTLDMGEATVVDAVDLDFLIGRAFISVWLSDATRRLEASGGIDDLVSGDDIGEMIRDGMSGRGAVGEDISSGDGDVEAVVGG